MRGTISVRRRKRLHRQTGPAERAVRCRRKPAYNTRISARECFDGALFENDPEFLTEIVGLFLETYPQLLTEIEDAISGQDAAGLCRAAHTLKGAVANFGAKAVVEQAETLETMGKTGDFSSVADDSRSLRALLSRFEPELRGALRRATEQVVT